MYICKGFVYNKGRGLTLERWEQEIGGELPLARLNRGGYPGTMLFFSHHRLTRFDGIIDNMHMPIQKEKSSPDIRKLAWHSQLGAVLLNTISQNNNIRRSYSITMSEHRQKHEHCPHHQIWQKYPPILAMMSGTASSKLTAIVSHQSSLFLNKIY